MIFDILKCFKVLTSSACGINTFPYYVYIGCIPYHIIVAAFFPIYLIWLHKKLLLDRPMTGVTENETYLLKLGENKFQCIYPNNNVSTDELVVVW